MRDCFTPKGGCANVPFMGVSRTVAALTCMWAAGIGGGCSDKSAELELNRTQLASGAERDATKGVRVPALGLALEVPGEGWKLMDAPAARAFAEGAVAGAVGPGSLAAVIVSEPVGEATVDAVAADRMLRLAGEAPSFEAVTVDETSGRRYAMSDGAIRRAGAFWVKAGIAFELRIWGTGDGVDAGVAALLGSMAFFPREGVLTEMTPRDQQGPDWRVSAGVYENAAAGLRVESPAGMRLVVGSELAERDAQADWMLLGTSSLFTLTVASEPVTSQAARASRASALVAKIGGDAAPPVEVTMLAKKTTLAQRKVGAEMVAFGDVCTEEVCHALFACYPASGNATSLTAALAAVAALPRERQAALDKELAAAPSAACTVGDGFALRGSTYRSFEHGFTFESPGPAWQLSAGRAAARRVEAASVFMEARRWGLEAALVVDAQAGDDGDAHHAAIVSALEARGAFKRDGDVAQQGERRLSEGRGALGLGFAVATQIVGERGVQLVVWGAAENMKAHHDEVIALVGGLSVGVQKAVEMPPGGYLDRRLGVSASMPVGWLMQEETPAELERAGTYVTWEQNGAFVGLLAVCLPRGADPVWSSGYLEQRLRERFGPISRGVAAPREKAVAGRDARGTSWQAPLEHIDVVVFTRENAVYALAAADHRGEALDELTRGFSFIE